MSSSLHRSISRVVKSLQTMEGGGFPVRRPLGSQDLDVLDPFLMLDHFGPLVSKPGHAVGAPDHPHRGFETVSYILSGAMQHKDSRGNTGDLQSGDVQWMTAGSGVVHSEMPSDEFQKTGGTMEGFQLWVNLPSKDKMIAPRYQDIRSASIPEATSEDKLTLVRVIAGDSLGTKAVIDTRTPIMYLDIRMQSNSKFEQKVPADYNGFVYVYRGSAAFSGVNISEGKLGVLGAGEILEISATDACSFLLIAGVPIKEPVARYGPFVMNTQAEIRQAFEDYQAGKLGEIPGSEERYKKTKEAKARQNEL